MNEWHNAQRWEKEWWTDCTNTYGEQEKQLLYANRIGLRLFHNGKSPYNIDVSGLSIIDIGSGPASLLLKCVGFERAMAVDPLGFPEWVIERYKSGGIEFQQQKAEDQCMSGFDEAWIYNVLQHVECLEMAIRQAQRAANIIRLFEWIDTPTNTGHIHTLTEGQLNTLLGGYGKVEQINGQANCFGNAYYGVFPTE